MIAHQKVVPPVTPKIVQTTPRQRIIRYALILFAFLLTGWFSYDAGQSQAPAVSEIPTTQSQASSQRITELEQERNSLKQQVAELESGMQQVSQALATERSRNRVPKQATTTRRKIPAQKPVAVPMETADFTLGLENIRIKQTASENVFQIAFSVINEANNTDRVLGTIWIAVNGFSGKEPRRLSFKRLSSDKRSYVKMGFNQKQDVKEDIRLPGNFRPKNILIEVRPYGEKYTGTSKKINWPSN